MTQAQYDVLLAQIYAAILMHEDARKIASLILQGTAYVFDVARVLNDVAEIPYKIVRLRSRHNEAILFERGMDLFSAALKKEASALYMDLGFSAYFEKRVTHPLR